MEENADDDRRHKSLKSNNLMGQKYTWLIKPQQGVLNE
jgi:hypothetical protein